MQNWSLSSCPWTSLDCITSPGLIMSIVISSAPFSLSDLSFSSINSASSISIKTCETNWNHTYVSKPWILSVIWPRNYWDQMCGLILTKCPINHNLANGVNGKQKVASAWECSKTIHKVIFNFPWCPTNFVIIFILSSWTSHTKFGNLTKMTELYPFLESKKCHLL